MGELSDIYREHGRQGVADYFAKRGKYSVNIPKKELVDTKHDTDSGMTPAQRRTIERVEAEDRGYKSEQVRLVDANGNLIFTKRGNRNHVGIPHSEVVKMKDGVLTHNHPFDEAYSKLSADIGVSLSAGDIGTMIAGDMREVRAQTDGYVFSLRRKSKSFGDEWYREGLEEAVREAWNDEYNRVWYRYSTNKREGNAVALKGGRYVKDGVRLDRINAIASHSATRLIAKMYGLEYTRRKQKGTAKKVSYKMM